ncbi:DEAD/DEAH box helicase [Desulfosediminicola ganghwensis]|uniref:DEAD/DEAH box helicase n=1 Tax=Desulfosediminicola ganghwensis TaxID=2569540 RepID=UPI0010AD45A8|nr:DEAD/DEAH box helicase [Desulfosediminicola ganghwensis]
MSFEHFRFHPSITSNISSCGYTTPTPIQEKTIPPILAGQDVLGLAQTGTGKTAAFVLPILQKLITGSSKKTRAVIIAPTRELAQQIHDTITSMTNGTALRSVVVYGGVGKQPQIKAIRSGVDIIVACPGRLLDLLKEQGISLRDVETFVLDEADHMFDKGFLPDIRRIIKQLPNKRQSLVFSATMPKAIRHLIEEILVDPCTVQIDHALPAATISHTLINVGKAQKTSLLKNLLTRQEMTSTVVFTRTKHKAKNLALQLEKAGLKAASIQGNLSQQSRRRAMDGFRDGTYRILVATDIAARGIDVSGVSHVINYDVPDTAETYTHRTGRTGRAKKSGSAITFADRDDRIIISLIEKNLGKKMNLEQIESFGDVKDNTTNPKGTSAPYRKTSQKRHPARTAPRKSNRSKATSFDFGINSLSS